MAKRKDQLREIAFGHDLDNTCIYQLGHVDRDVLTRYAHKLMVAAGKVKRG